jgi:hypothetical protein
VIRDYDLENDPLTVETRIDAIAGATLSLRQLVCRGRPLRRSSATPPKQAPESTSALPDHYETRSRSTTSRLSSTWVIKWNRERSEFVRPGLLYVKVPFIGSETT